MRKILLLFFLFCSSGLNLWSQIDTVSKISPQEYERRRILAEKKWHGTFKGMYEDWLQKWIKPHVVLYKYTDGNSNEFGYLNFGNGKGRLEVSEMEYLALQKYMK